MKIIDKLLRGAPVEWKPLGEIAEIFGGLTGKNKGDFNCGKSLYITYKNIFENLEVNTNILEYVNIKDSEKQNLVQYGDILFTGSSESLEEAGMSSVVTKDLAENIYLNSFSFGVRFNQGIDLSPHFAKYLFRCHYMRKAISKTASGVTRYNISKNRFKKILIPIPPLSVQEQIVEILDKFTTLEAELEAELEARIKQYEFYREQLLNFNDNQVQWKTLGEVCNFQNGFAFKSELFKENGCPIIRITNINGKTVDFGNLIYFNPADYKKISKEFEIKKGDILIAMSGATTGKIGYYEKDTISYLNQRVGKFIPNKELLNNKFLYHFLLSKSSSIYNLAVGGGAQPNLSSNSIKKSILIPIPPLEEQERIVAILDKFHTLTTSLTEGLPHEIALRRKQYEYYREQLLDFPRPEN